MDTKGSQGKMPQVLFSSDSTKDVKPCEPISVKQPSVLFPKSPPKTTPDAVFAGMARKRIAVTIAQVAACDTSITDRSILSTALGLIVTTNLDDDRDEKIIYWGTDLQKQHGKLLEDEFALTQDGLLSQAKQGVNKVVAILKGLDSISASSAKPWFSIFSSKEIEIKPSVTNLQATVKDLESKVPKLQTLLGNLERYAKIEDTLATAVVASILAAKFLVQYINSGIHPNQAVIQKLKSQVPALERRVSGLVATQSALVVNVQQKNILLATIADLIDCVQNTLLVEIPLWYTAYLALTAVETSKTNSADKVAQRQQLAQRQQVILTKLKSYGN